MENATKTLIIAAAVLIAIVLVAVGVLLIRNVTNTSDQADEVGNLIGQASDNASSAVIGGTKGIIISKDKFNSFINDFSKKYKTASQLEKAILNDQNKKLSNQIQIIGYVYQDDYTKINSERTTKYIELLNKTDSKNQEKNKEFFNYAINEWIPDLLEKGKIIGLKDALDKAELKEKIGNVYKDRTGQELTDEMYEDLPGWKRWYFGYDKWGYINKAVYIAMLDF